MNNTKLTGFRRAARVLKAKSHLSGAGRVMVRSGIVTAGAALLGGCINVTAPEEPIVIELNVNIRADVVYRLAEDAANTVEENADIF